METLTNGALSTVEGMRLLGDAAAVAQQPIQELAVWVGRAYDGLQSNRPIGEAMMRMQELGLVSGNTRNQIERLQKQGKGKEAWLILQKELQKTEGAMEKLSKTSAGLWSNLKDAITETLVRVGEPALEKIKLTLSGLINTVEDFAASPAFDSLVENFTNFVDISRAVLDTSITIFKAFTGAQGTLLTLATGFALLATNTKLVATAFSLVAAHPILATITALTAGFVLLNKQFQDTIDNAALLENKIQDGFKLTESQIVEVNKGVALFKQRLTEIRDIEAGNRKARHGELRQLKRRNDATREYLAKVVGVAELDEATLANLPNVIKAQQSLTDHKTEQLAKAKEQADVDKATAEALARREKLQSKIASQAAAGLAFAKQQMDVERGLSTLRTQDLGIDLSLEGTLESTVAKVGDLVERLRALKSLGVAEDSKEYVSTMDALTDSLEKAGKAQLDFNNSVMKAQAELTNVNAQIEAMGGTAVIEANFETNDQAIQAAEERAAILGQIDEDRKLAQIELASNERERIEMEKNWAIEQEREKYDAQMELLQKHDQDTERATLAHQKRLAVIEKKNQKKLDKVAKAQRDQDLKDAEYQIAVAQQVANATFSIASAAFGRNKGIAIAEAIVNTALGATKALAQGGALGFATAAAVTAAGVAQVATISRQKLARGGLPQGENAQVTMNEHGQEAVLNNNAYERMGRQNIEAINRGANPNSLFGGGGGQTITQEFYFSPTNEFNGSESPDVVEALRNQPEEFVAFIEEAQTKGMFQNV